MAKKDEASEAIEKLSEALDAFKRQMKTALDELRDTIGDVAGEIRKAQNEVARVEAESKSRDRNIESNILAITRRITIAERSVARLERIVIPTASDPPLKLNGPNVERFLVSGR